MEAMKPQAAGAEAQRPMISFNENSVLMAFIMVIFTLLIITLAMFKMAGSMVALSDRLQTLENRLAQYSMHCIYANSSRAGQ